MHTRSSQQTLNRWGNQWARFFVVVTCIFVALVAGYGIFQVIENGRTSEKSKEITGSASVFRVEESAEKKDKPVAQPCDTIAANGIPDCVAICNYDTQDAIADCVSGVCQWPALLDDGIADCASANLAPELKNGTLRIAPNSGEYQVDVSRWLFKNKLLTDRDNSLPLTVSRIRLIEGTSVESGNQRVATFAGDSTVLFSLNAGIMTIRPAAGGVGDVVFAVGATDAFGAVSNEAQLTISIRCGSHEQWNASAGYCERILDGEVLRRVASQDCADQILVFAGSTVCAIALEENTRYVQNGIIEAQIIELKDSSGECAIVEPGVVVVPFAWRQSLVCGPLSLGGILKRGYFSGAVSVSIGGMHRMFGIAGRVGSCPTASVYMAASGGGYCRCSNDQMALDMRTKTCQATIPTPLFVPQKQEQQAVAVAEILPLVAPQLKICDPPYYRNTENICVGCSVNSIVSSVSTCVPCAQGEFTSVDRLSCVVCDAIPGNGIPDCLSECSFGDEVGRIACIIGQKCDQTDTLETRDNGLPQCPQAPTCNNHAHDEVPDCVQSSGSCNTQADDGVGDCPRDGLDRLVVPALVDISPGDSVVLVKDLPGYISVELSGISEHGVVSIGGQAVYSHDGAAEALDRVDLAFSDRYGNVRHQAIMITAVCPTSTGWNPTLHQCGQVLRTADVGECQGQDFAGTFGCRFEVIDSPKNIFTLPTRGFYAALESEDGDMTVSSACTIELNMSDSVALICLFPGHPIARSVQVWLQYAGETVRRNAIFVASIAQKNMVLCDAVSANGIPDCVAYCNTVLGDYIPDCSTQQCDFEFDNAIADCPVALVFSVHAPLPVSVLTSPAIDSYLPTSGVAILVLILLSLTAVSPKIAPICIKKTAVLYW